MGRNLGAKSAMFGSTQGPREKDCVPRIALLVYFDRRSYDETSITLQLDNIPIIYSLRVYLCDKTV